jgi:hypothetical protein
VKYVNRLNNTIAPLESTISRGHDNMLATLRCLFRMSAFGLACIILKETFTKRALERYLGSIKGDVDDEYKNVLSPAVRIE